MHHIQTFDSGSQVQTGLNDQTYERTYVAYVKESETFDYNSRRPQVLNSIYPTAGALDGGKADAQPTDYRVDGTIADLDILPNLEN